MRRTVVLHQNEGLSCMKSKFQPHSSAVEKVFSVLWLIVVELIDMKSGGKETFCFHELCKGLLKVKRWLKLD